MPVLLLLLFVSGCASQEIVKEVAKEQATRVVTKVVRVVQETPPPPLPPLPSDCRVQEGKNAKVGDSLEKLIAKSDARIARCAKNYDRIRMAHSRGKLNGKAS